MSVKTAEVVTCAYAGCRGKPAVGELRAHLMWRPNKQPWPLCEDHIKAEAHPPDLRKHLHRWRRFPLGLPAAHL